MTAVVFSAVIGAALLHAAWNALVKVNTDRFVLMATMAAIQTMLSVAVLPFVPVPAPASWPYLLASVALHNAYYLFLITAYRYGDLSHVYPLARGTAPLIVATASFVLVGEALSLEATVYIALIAFGIMSLTLTRGAAGFREPKAVFSAIATGIFIAAYTVSDGLGVRLSGDAHGYTFWLFALDGVPITALALYLLRGRLRKEVAKSWKMGALTGIISLIAYWIVIWAMATTPIAMVSALRETSMVFAVMFGVFFLKERLNLMRVVSVAVTLAGAVMLKLSN